MSRNVESRFAENPTRIDMSRSTFDRNSSVKLTFNAGDLIPFYVDEVLPGDTFQIKSSKVVRMQSLLTPLMDNMFLDTYWFFVPNRLVWSHWKEFMGENTQSAWIPQVEYSIPQLVSPYLSASDNGWECGTIADYMGIPTNVKQLSVNALPFRGYALICNEWFRDENLSDPLVIPLTDAQVVGTNGSGYIQDVAKGGKPFKVSKYHDYFTSCLPSPQKGPDVTLPISSGGTFPVIATSDVHDSGNQSIHFQLPSQSTSGFLMAGKSSSGGNINTWMYNSTDTENAMRFSAYPDNLWALDTDPQVATINQLRMAFQIQKFYERDARGGTRYIELLKSHFGVTSPDARLQRPEYLGGNRIPINVNQIVQQSETGSTPQGTPTGLSLTTDVHGDFSKSFVEHGFVFGLCCVRYGHTYQQGLERMWSRTGRFDYYWPVFANIGEQAVKNKEIYAQGKAVVDSDNNIIDDLTFGFQEAWADYRYKPSRVSGEMRSNYSQSLDVWHLADDYASLPILSDSWIREDSTNVNRVIAVSEQNAHQFFADIYVQNRTTRPMPVYSIPGLVDHH